MTLFTNLSLVLAAAALLFAGLRIALRFMLFFQQEEYDNRRFLRWWIRTRSFETRVTGLCLLAGAFIAALRLAGYSIYEPGVPIAASAGVAALASRIRTGEGKKPLAVTQRVKRIVAVSAVPYAGCLAALGFAVPHPLIHSNPLLAAVPALLAMPLWLVLGNLFLAPFEARIRRRYMNEARAILRDVNPTVIGITGSYGKTSAKHLLAHVLASHAPTLATPGSVNTLMGITRVIREKLTRDHLYFIAEMGAYGPGSIQRLCDFTPPSVGWVTTVGLAHYERFKSVETVAMAKSELPRSLPKDGLAILFGDNPHCRAMAEATDAEVYFYGEDASAGRLDCRLAEKELTPDGIRVVLECLGKTHSFVMPLYGSHQALNAAGAFLAAVKLGVPAFTAVAAMQTAPQVRHRLEVRRDPGGVVTIDDAYNSNPAGFESALEVLRVLPGGRKILVTPGMVELGGKAREEHEKIAALAAPVCDIILVVAPSRIPWFAPALRENGFPAEKLLEFPSLAPAREWLGKNLLSGDAVLFENDLPDLYESPSAF